MAETTSIEEEREGHNTTMEPLLPREPITTTNDAPPHPNPSKPSPSSSNALAFWAYFTLSVSLLTLLLSSLLPLLLSPPDHRAWFLSLPDDLRLHYSQGKLIKAYPNPSSPPIQVFAVEHGPREERAEAVLLVHGLGSSSYSFRRVLSSLGSLGLRSVAIDLPGSGFSDNVELVGSGARGGLFGRFWDVYSEIREKGFFWAFDQLIETGEIPYEEIGRRSSPSHGGEGFSGYGSAEIGRVIEQVVDSMALAPVHLVLHDSALGPGTNWAAMNPSALRSVTFIDTLAENVAFPSWILGVPVFGELLLRSRMLFAGLLRLCCARSMDESAAEVHRLLLMGKDKKRAVVATGKALNYSFDLREWKDLEAVKDMPLQMLWSNNWSDRWIDEAQRVSSSIPFAKFAYHSGGRWPQEDAADEISQNIVDFVNSLPRSIKKVKDEPLPEHIQKMLEEANRGHYDHHDPGHHHHHDGRHHHGHGHGHGHEHAAGYMGMYGLGQGWGR
ncbi:protein AUXIN RESPONSE 4 [Ananas comosus]|uniref:Protein AUXIN RESPONSE 4 n=1 Tax=Ananas comosus TaxID=4615 RepID=A0A6P5GFW1_ANACO|nr:protein AUXIN RESPONSE 4 [Ananas comosus]